MLMSSWRKDSKDLVASEQIQKKLIGRLFIKWTELLKLCIRLLEIILRDN